MRINIQKMRYSSYTHEFDNLFKAISLNMKYMGDTLGTVHSITNEISKPPKFKLGP